VSFSGSAFVAPIIGAALYEQFGYRGAFDIMQFLLYGIGFFYWFFVAGLTPFKSYKKQMDEQAALQEITDKIQALRNGDEDV
jgi:MFS family permease